MKLSEWLNHWLEFYIKPTVKIRTYLKYKYTIDKHIIPFLGCYDLNELSLNRLQAFFYNKIKNGNLLNQKPLAISTVKGIYVVFNLAMKTAVSAEYTTINNIKNVKLPVSNKNETKIFTKQEQSILIDYCLKNNKKNYIGVLICLFTGIRLGELLALTWNDISFENNSISINKTTFNINNNGTYEKIVATPKTNTSKRIIPISKSLSSILLKTKKNSFSKYVISTKKNTMVETRSYQRTFVSIQKKCNIKRRNFHVLRHPYVKHTTKKI